MASTPLLSSLMLSLSRLAVLYKNASNYQEKQLIILTPFTPYKCN